MAYALTNTILRIVIHIFILIFSIAYILAGQLQINQLRLFKVFPLILLILLIVPKQSNTTMNKLIIGLICGVIGDQVLEYEGQSDYFAVGAGFFLLGHIFYNFSFFDIWPIIDKNCLLHRKFLLFFGCIGFLCISNINLSTTISDQMKNKSMLMVILMPVYVIFLTMDSIHAYLLMIANKKPNKNYILLFIGCIMFLISDNVLGRAIFADFRILDSHKINSIVIMSTYYLGQYLIVLNTAQIIQKQFNIKNINKRESLLSQTQTSI